MAYIQKVHIENYRSLKNRTVTFNESLNILVGDNECGKSTLLEAINLALTGQLNGRFVLNEIHPFLCNMETASAYLASLSTNTPLPPPTIKIEIFLQGDEPEIVRLKGTNNSTGEDVAGIKFTLQFDEDNETFKKAYAEYLEQRGEIRFIPIEYYIPKWMPFSGNPLSNTHNIPFKPNLIDASAVRNDTRANKYTLDLARNCMEEGQAEALALAYRKMKDDFLQDANIQSINTHLANLSDISSRQLSISLDTTSKASWENSIVPHLGNIPLPLIGKGEQSQVKIKLGMLGADKCHLLLIEEPENHLSHHNLNNLIKNIKSKAVNKQSIITTHSSFVLNKLGVENVLLFTKDNCMSMKDLGEETYDYFMKLPGHNTLRLILSPAAILVEGPSDELMLMKAFKQKFNVSPLEKGVDVITVNGLSFKRFMEISKILNIKTAVVTDNDGDLTALSAKYMDFKGLEDNIKVFYDSDINAKTLEVQIVKNNNLAILNDILGTTYPDLEKATNYMLANKTEAALSIFNSNNANFVMPNYINDAVDFVTNA